MRTDYISEITGSTKGMWSPGVFAIEHLDTGRRLYVGTTNVGRRYRDHAAWLRRGVHPNPDLQQQWTAQPDQFRFLLVQRVAVEGMVDFVKQTLIDLDRRDRPPGPYNVRNAVPSNSEEPLAADWWYTPPLPPELPVRTPLDAYKKVLEVLGDDAFDAGVWDKRLRNSSRGPTTPLTKRQEAAAKLLGGLPSAKHDSTARVDELIRRVHRLLGRGHEAD